MLTYKKNFTYNPLFWILFATLSLAALIFSYRFFSKTFPIVDLNITMDRQQALEKSKELAKTFHLQPEKYHQAVSFETESEVQTFVELEAGGPKEFSNLIKEGIYSPYYWKVRHFKEYDAHEAEFYFKPNGTLYGFLQKIPEDEIGTNLSSDEALKKAMLEASTDWGINFTLFKIVENGHETTSKGRVDHTFVFERTDKKVGEASYRLKLMVKGDRFSELKQSIKVPQNFKKKYQEMRSSNNFIAFLALVIMLVLYLFCGCFFGLFYLVRSSYLDTKWALFWALIISSLQLLNDFNQIPLLWMQYDTALSIQQYFGYLIIKIIYHFFMYFSISILLICVAEGLTRKAFPKHIQLWKMWDHQAGASWQVLGRTLAGYLSIGFDFAYCIGFYYFTLKYLGWWSPSDALYNPNELATYFPWLTPIVSSLSAGFLEECGFRAIPLACAALLGQRFGRKNVWIAAAFILQAIIFGAAHANYAAQPAYARLIELIVPSFAFGFLYLRYGLLPAILSHFLYDVVWFALPIFITHGSAFFFDKVLVILFCLIPLCILLIRRMQGGRWISLASSLYNSAWQPKAIFQTYDETHSAQPDIAITKQKTVFYSLFGLIGIIFLMVFFRFKYDTVPLALQRNDAISIAKEAVKDEHLDSSWNWLASVEVPLEKAQERNQHMFVWRKFGKQMYHNLLKNYLDPEFFKVRAVKFAGSIDERTEEYEISIDNTHDGLPQTRRIHHIIPENNVHDSMPKEEALNLAYKQIYDRYNLAKSDLTVISAIPTQFPQGLGWKFTFQDKQIALDDGQARILVEIAGKHSVDAYRFIFVPEQWDREFKDEITFITMLELWRLLLLVIFIACAAVIILASLRHLPKISWTMFFTIAVILISKSFFQALNIWPIVTSGFVTSEPFNHQASSTILFWIVYAFFIAVGSGLIIGFLQTKLFKSSQIRASFKGYIFYSCCVGLFYVGCFTVMKYFFASMSPQWPIYTYAAANLPWVSQVLSMISQYIEYTLFSLLFFTAFDYLYYWLGNSSWLLIPCMLLFGLTTVEFHIGLPWLSVVSAGLVSGILLWIVYYFVLRHLRAAIPICCALIKIVEVVPMVLFHAYPGITLGWFIGAIALSALALFWSYNLYKTD